MSSMLGPEDGNVSNLILVSACLLGTACRFDGSGCPVVHLVDLAARGRLLPFCPEVSGGLATPRLPAEIEQAYTGLDGHSVLQRQTRVLRSDGADVTAQYIAGAERALALAEQLGVQRAILKASSPACGVGRIYDGRFKGNLVPGDGVTTAALKQAGIQVTTELELMEGKS